MRRAKRAWVVIALACAATAPVAEASRWRDNNSGAWEDRFRWDDLRVPQFFDFVTIDTDPPGATVTISSDAAAREVALGSGGSTVGNLTVNGTLSADWLFAGTRGTGNVVQNGSVFLEKGLAVGNPREGRGSYVLNAGRLEAQVFQFGVFGIGTFEQFGGEVRSVVNDPAAGTAMLVGVGPASGPTVTSGDNGTYRLHAGDVVVRYVEVGGHGAQDSRGTFEQLGGSVAAGYLGIGGNGTYRLQGGELTTGAGSGGPGDGLARGFGGRGRFVHSAGTHRTNEFYLYGRYELSGGDLNVAGGNAVMFGEVAAPARFVQTGGTVNVPADPFDPFAFQGRISLQSHSAYELDGDGEVRADVLSVDDSGTAGGFRQAGGSVDVRELRVGVFSDGPGVTSGQYHLSGGELAVNAPSVVGQFNGGSGSFRQSGGTAGFGFLSVEGPGSDLRVSGGSFHADQLFVGGGAALRVSGDGVLTAGERFADYAGLQVFHGSTVTQTGGFVSVNDLELAGAADAPARYLMSGGGVEATGEVSLGSAAGDRFEVSGGSLNTGDVVVTRLAGQHADVTVTGAGTVWRVLPGGNLRQATVGTGSFSVSDGAEVELSARIHSPTVEVSGGGKIHMQGGGLVANDVRVRAGGTVVGSGTVTSVAGTASVTNAGTLRVQGEYGGVPGTGGSRMAQLLVHGDYAQAAGGELHLIVNDQNRTTAAGPAHVPLVVTGSAAFNGELSVDSQFLSPGGVQPGARYRLVEAGAIMSRFSKFSGSAIPGRDDVFFGLNYASDGKRLDLITLETPRRVTPGVGTAGPTVVPLTQGTSSKLVLITHGWVGDAGSWARDLAAHIAADASGYDVATVDWGPYASVLTPWRAAANAFDIGRSLDSWLGESGLAGVYTSEVHLMGHSAGAWLVDALADRLRAARPGLAIHVTFFDAFTPVDDDGNSTVPVLAPGGPLAPGDSATFAQHVVDKSAVPVVGAPLIPFTDLSLPHAFNVDVTLARRAGDTLDPHGWPYQWYDRTVHGGVPPFQLAFGREYGYPLSAISGAAFPSHALYARGDTHVVTSMLLPGPSVAVASVSPTAANSIVSDTGTVTFGGDGTVTLATGSPVMLTTPVDLESPANLVSMDVEFLSDAAGLLSVYLDGSLLVSFDSVLFADLDGPYDTGDLWLPEALGPGRHTLIFRLDPLGDQQALARVGDVRFSYLQVGAIPEPAGGALVVAGGFAAATVRGRRQRRYRL